MRLYVQSHCSDLQEGETHINEPVLGSDNDSSGNQM